MSTGKDHQYREISIGFICTIPCGLAMTCHETAKHYIISTLPLLGMQKNEKWVLTLCFYAIILLVYETRGPEGCMRHGRAYPTRGELFFGMRE